MITYDSCPEKLPLPDYPTLDGKPLYPDWRKNPVEIAKYERLYIESVLGRAVPTLVSIGLLDALLEVERVLAWNQTEKHPGAKWKSKSVDWHDSKAVSHLSKAQIESLKDDETGCSHRAHAACRLLMSLAHELNQNNS